MSVLKAIVAAKQMRELDDDERERFISEADNVCDLRPRLHNVALGLSYAKPKQPEK